MVTTAILLMLAQGDPVGRRLDYECRAITPDMAAHRAAFRVQLPAGDFDLLPAERSVHVTLVEADEALFPGATRPQTVEAVDRSSSAREPGYVQFGLSTSDHAYQVAIHNVPGGELPVHLYVTRSDWRGGWYWASGFCSRPTEGVQ